MSLCVVIAGKATVLAVTAFTLGWTHSVEKVRWEEDWHVTPAGLELVTARIKGSAAGMEVPDGAVLEGGVWTFRPSLAPQKALLLARSGATGQGWSLCTSEGCMTIGKDAGPPAEIRPCSDGEGGAG